MNIRLPLVGIVLISLASISACATSGVSSIGESDGQIMLADSYIGEAYDDVMSRAALHYATEPQCELRKVSLNKQRKAFQYQICGFTPERKRFLGAPLEEVVYHFIENELVRVDISAQGETALFESVRDDIAAVFGSSKAIQSSLSDNSYQWTAEQHVAGVRVGSGANTGQIQVRLVDGTLVDNAPWLAAE